MTSLARQRCCLSIVMIAGISLLHAQAQLSERDQHTATEHFKRGMDALLGEKYDTAEQEFRAVVKVDPLYDAAFYGLGQTYMATKRFDAAVKAYTSAREAFQSATAAEALENVTSDRRLKDQIDALKDHERSLTRQTNVVQNPSALGPLERVREQIRQLESRMGRRTGSTPPPVPAGLSMALGSAYFRLNQLDDAEREYKAAVEVNPSFGEAHSNLAVVYLVKGRIEEADASLKAAEKAGFRVNPRLKSDIEAARRK